MTTTKLRGYDTLEKLGEGGQSEVYKVRKPGRVQQRYEQMREFSRILLEIGAKGIPAESASIPGRFGELAELAHQYARSDDVSELGALKLFKIPTEKMEADQALGRLKNEIAVLQQGRPGLVKLIEGNERETFMVTEFIPGGSLEKHLSKYKGNVFGALKAFRSLVETVASLHRDSIIHRDIKPANVFPTENDGLLLGDFGIVYLPDQAERLTMTQERVGPRDYMPQWGDLGERLENVQPNFDVYMLGKLLWCMVTGRLKLPREYHKRPAYDVTVLFSQDPNMRKVNEILEKCVVEEPQQCLKSAQDLLVLIDEALVSIQNGLPMLDDKGNLILPCRVCGRGFYREHRSVQFHINDQSSRPASPIYIRMFVCNVCTNYELFAPNFPEEAAKKNWKPWLELK